MINRELKAKALPLECHHASWRDRGLFPRSLRDKNNILTIRSFAQMTLSDDMGIRTAIRQFIENE
jgi:hypothetical protein